MTVTPDHYKRMDMAPLRKLCAKLQNENDKLKAELAYKPLDDDTQPIPEPDDLEELPPACPLCEGTGQVSASDVTNNAPASMKLPCPCTIKFEDAS